MKNNLKTLCAIATISLGFLSPINSHANPNTSVNFNSSEQIVEREAISNSSSNNEELNAINNIMQETVPSVTTEEVFNKAERMGFDVVMFLTTLSKPFFIVCFVGSAFLTGFAIFSKNSIWNGFIGMFISGLCYGFTVFAPEIVNFFANWMAK